MDVQPSGAAKRQLHEWLDKTAAVDTGFWRPSEVPEGLVEPEEPDEADEGWALSDAYVSQCAPVTDMPLRPNVHDRVLIYGDSQTPLIIPRSVAYWNASIVDALDNAVTVEEALDAMPEEAAADIDELIYDYWWWDDPPTRAFVVDYLMDGSWPFIWPRQLLEDLLPEGIGKPLAETEGADWEMTHDELPIVIEHYRSQGYTVIYDDELTYRAAWLVPRASRRLGVDEPASSS